MDEKVKRSKPAGSINRKLEEQLKKADLKDQVISNLDYLEPENARELARLLLWSDSAFSFGLLGQLPHSLNFAVAFFDELGRQLHNVPPDLLRQFTVEMARNVDTKSMAALPKTYAPLLAALGSSADDQTKADPLQKEKKIRFIREKIDSADFGKVRSSVKNHLEEHYPLVESTVEAIISDPVVFANLINILPPLLNHLLKVTASALKQIDYPPEILASALFNLANDLEAEELGTIINNVNRLINNLHEGSAILGGSEPRFRRVLENILEKTLQDIDEEAAAAALLALGEDLETVFCAAADTALKKPELTAELFIAMMQGSSAALRGMNYMLDRLYELPSGYFAHFTESFTNNQPAESAKLINSLVALSNRILTENPLLLEKIAVSFSQSVDRKELQNLLRNILQQKREVYGSEEALLELFPPQDTAEALNKYLASFNQKMKDKPSARDEILSLYLQHLDQDQLSAALLNTSDRLADSLAKNPQLSRSVIRAFFRMLWGLLKGSFKRAGKKERRRH